MTFREKYEQDRAPHGYTGRFSLDPQLIHSGGRCPHDYGYCTYTDNLRICGAGMCNECWNHEMPEETPNPLAVRKVDVALEIANKALIKSYHADGRTVVAFDDLIDIAKSYIDEKEKQDGN